MIDNEFSEVLEQAIEAKMTEMNTAQPGVIVSYDAARNRAVVRPTLPKRLADGTELQAPDIHEVPVQWVTASAGVSMTFPIRPGDGVMLIAQQRSLDKWLGGNNAAPDDPRLFDMTDVVALPGLKSSHTNIDPNNIVLRMEGSTVTIEPGGTVRIVATKLRVEGDMEVTGDITVDGDVIFGPEAISAIRHKHKDVTPGSGTSGKPIPA